MIKDKIIGVILIIIFMSLCGCGTKDTKKYEIPLEVFFLDDSSDMSEEEMIYMERFFEECINDGMFESATINSQNIVEIECTSEQVETQKKNRMADLKISPSIAFPGTSHTTYSYNEDFTEITLYVTEDDYNNYTIITPHISSMLMFQIYNGIPYQDAKVMLEIVFTDTGETEVKEYTCFNFYK